MIWWFWPNQNQATSDRLFTWMAAEKTRLPPVSVLWSVYFSIRAPLRSLSFSLSLSEGEEDDDEKKTRENKPRMHLYFVFL